MYSLLLITESKTQISWDNFWLCCTSHRINAVFVQWTARTDPWSITLAH